MSNDVTKALTIAELDAGSRLIKGDMLTALTSDSPNRVAALAVSAWLLARRTDRAAQLNTFRAMTLDELRVELGDTDEPADQPMTVTDRQLVDAATQLGVGFVELATALGLDAAEPPVEQPVDQVLVDAADQVADPPAEPATEPAPDVVDVIEDPTAPGLAPTSPEPGAPTP